MQGCRIVLLENQSCQRWSFLQHSFVNKSLNQSTNQSINQCFLVRATTSEKTQFRTLFYLSLVFYFRNKQQQQQQQQQQNVFLNNHIKKFNLPSHGRKNITRPSLVEGSKSPMCFGLKIDKKIKQVVFLT